MNKTILGSSNILIPGYEACMFSKDTLTIHELTEVVVKVLNARDPYTFAHSWRVAKISELIAVNLKIERQWIERIHIAAHLHDIGKTGVPDAILNKTGKLTAKEYEIMKTHSMVGFSIISRLPVLDDISIYVKHHHERYDGKGYPEGIKGKDIPLGSRIIAVADTFDALTSKRNYRDACSYEQAFDIIKNVSGSQLCPECVECFLGMTDELAIALKNVNDNINNELNNEPGKAPA